MNRKHPRFQERLEQLGHIIQAKRREFEGTRRDLNEAVKCLHRAQEIHYEGFIQKWLKKIDGLESERRTPDQVMAHIPDVKVDRTNGKRRRLVPAKQIAAVGEVRRIAGRGVGKWGYVERGGQGHFVITPQWEKASKFSEGLAAVKHRGRYGYVNEDGELVIEYRFAEAGQFSKSRARVKRHRREYYINIRGEECLDQSD